MRAPDFYVAPLPFIYMDSPTRAAFDGPTRDQLIESHLPLVYAIVNRIWAKGGIAGIERDDLISEGAIGLIHAADSFDGSRNARFSTWATIKIRSAIGSAIRKQRTRNKRESSGVDAEVRADLLADTDLRDLDEKIVLDKALVILNCRFPRLHTIIDLIYCRSKTKVEVAEILGVSDAHVERLHQDALQFLREHFATTDQV